MGNVLCDCGGEKEGQWHVENCAKVKAMKIENVLEERGKTHGDFVENSAITQAIKVEMRTGRSWLSMSNDQKEALEMVAHKIGRICAGDASYADHWADITGYATLVANRLSSDPKP